MISKKFNLFLNSKISNFKKKINVDSDKSISIRSFLIGSISNSISKANNVLESEDVFSTPRRLAIIFYNIHDKTPEKELVKKGPKLSDSFASSGEPNNVGKGFAKSVNQRIEDLITIGSGADKRLAFKTIIKPALLIEQAPSILESCLTKIQNAKGMLWGAGILKFARPIRWITIIIDDKALDGQVFNLKISGYSRGHRILGKDQIVISSADRYPQLLEENKVIVDRALRKKIIIEQIQKIAKTEMCRPLKGESLVEEVVDFSTSKIGASPMTTTSWSDSKICSVKLWFTSVVSPASTTMPVNWVT